MFFLMFLLICAAVWLLWNICKNTGDALDKQTAIQYELVSLEKKLEALSDKLTPESADTVSEISNVKKTKAPVLVDADSPNAEALSKTVNINKASLKEMTQLPRIGKALAQRIIDGRPYSGIEGVKQVQGISDEVFSEIKSLVSVES